MTDLAIEERKMAGFAAQLLNELMGANRNCAPNDKSRELYFDDEQVCKHMLCGFCPHDLFTNTRADLGICNKLHDDELRKKYQQSSRFERLGYEEDMVRFLQTLLSDVDKRIRKGHARLALNSAQGSLMGGPQVAREEKIEMLTEKINELVEQAEVLGCEGKVEEAQGVMKLCEQLQEERGQLQTIDQRREQGTGKDMEVCDVCGALLVVGDAQQRIDEHIMGKQHMGYAQIRAYIDGRKKKRQDEESQREERLKKEREEREKERDREREERQKQREEREKREQEKVKEREREREERRKKRSRSRDRRRRSRSRDRRRSRSRSSRRSRSRDRGRKSRDRRSSRERRRSRSRSRGSSRSKRSRESRDRDRSRDRTKSHDRDRSRDRERSKEKSRDHERERSYDSEKSHDREKSRDRERSNDREKSHDRSKGEDKMDIVDENGESGETSAAPSATE